MSHPAPPLHLTAPHTNLFYNLEVSAARYPEKPFIIFYDTPISFRRFQDEAERIAGYLQSACGVRKGDRVLLYMQNSPQWMLAYYGILRADAVVVPVNPMNRAEEVRHLAADSAATVMFAAQESAEEAWPLVEAGVLRHLVVAAYADYLEVPTTLAVPAAVAEPARPVRPPAVAWRQMLAAGFRPGPMRAGPDDLCVIPYTSGTTGRQKGCMHTHRTVMHTSVGGAQWFGRTQDDVFLAVLPLFHVTGMIGSMNGPLYLGATVVLLPRWDRLACAELIERHRVSVWHCISTMVMDFVADAEAARRDLSSLRVVRGGGAAMPQAVADRLRELTGLAYVEGYGMSETISATHINPPDRPKPQCLGLPVYGVDARLLQPGSAEAVGPGEVGEIAIAAPQVMLGYWNDAEATARAFIEIDGKRFLRTGDLGRVDEDGYYFMVDRLKRMINAAGFKVWPAEVESVLFQHPAVRECCVVGVPDTRRGEAVKAFVVLRSDAGRVTAADLQAWMRERMAAYKCPGTVEFLHSLPRSSAGKVQWRELRMRT